MTGNFMTVSETHSNASVKKTGFEDGCITGSMVASKIGMLMWSTDKTHKDILADHLSTMEQRPHANTVLAAKGHMQHKWSKSHMGEQEVVKKEPRKLKAHTQGTYGSEGI